MESYFTGDGQGGPLQKVPYGQKSAHRKAVRHSITGKSCIRQKQLQGKRHGRAWYIQAGLGLRRRHSPIV